MTIAKIMPDDTCNADRMMIFQFDLARCSSLRD
jgi:hypothetical protein